MSGPVHIVPQPSCADPVDQHALPVAVARARILERTAPLADTERLALRQCLDRVLAEPVHSTIDVPGHTNSAMDGYAIRGADLAADGSATLTRIGQALAGHPYDGSVAAGQCIRIMTGAPMPAGTDTVVMQEHSRVDGDRISFAPGQRSGQNVRQAGEDVARGQVVLDAGRRITAADLGLLASLGCGELTVYRRPRVAFFSTGDELRSIGQPLGEGEIYDSNRYSLHGMLARLGVEIRDLGVVPDDPAALEAALTRGAADCDAVITTGGVSVGEADYLKGLLERLGEMHLWKIAMKPGRPVTFGRIGAAAYFGLPGNPVSVMVTFYQFVQPALRHLAGERASEPLMIQAVCDEPLRKRPGRCEFQRGILSHAEDGRLHVRRTGSQGSGVLTSMSRANCFIVLDENSGSVADGEIVQVQPFAGLI